MARILYVSTIFNKPAGGVRMIFHHVRELRRLGFEAFVVSPGGGELQPGWFDADAPILQPPFMMFPDDVLVLPEVAPAIVAELHDQPSRKVLFCQNHFAAFEGLGDFAGWAEAGVDHAMYCSQVVADAVGGCFPFRHSAVIRCGIDRALFQPAADKQVNVVLMPRKRPGDVRLIRKAFERRWPQYLRYPWFGCDGESERAVAGKLGRASVFLSLSRREGLGLPPLEAMASGCLVAGFTGLGGRDYATPDNGFWADEEDVFGAADAVGQALRTLLTEPRRAAAMRAAGLATAARYSFDAMREDLKAFWSRVLAG